MNTANRVIVVVLLLVAILLCTIVLLLPVPVLRALSGQLSLLAEYVDSVSLWMRLTVGVLAAVALDAIAVILLAAELKRPATSAIPVEKTSGAEVHVSVGSIADRLRYEVDQVEGVLRSKARLSARRGKVTVEVDVETVTGLNVPQKAEEIVETVRRVAEDQMGLKLRRAPKVSLHAVPYPSVKQASPPPPAADISSFLEQ
jgi:hypothetical protein